MPRPPAMKTGPMSLARKCDRSMVSSPIWKVHSRRVTLESDEPADGDQENAKAGEKAGAGDNSGADEIRELRRDDPERANRHEDPAGRRERAAPVARPDIVHIEDVETGDERQDSGKIDERQSGEELHGHLAISGLIRQHADADRAKHRSDQPRDDQRFLHRSVL